VSRPSAKDDAGRVATDAAAGAAVSRPSAKDDAGGRFPLLVGCVNFRKRERTASLEARFAPDPPLGATYEDRAGSEDGVTGTRLVTGAAGRSRLSVTAKGQNVPPIDHFDSATLFKPGTSVRVQLHNLESGKCWGTTFADFRKNNANGARARVP
jgi:hypothetical protein